MIKYFLAFLLIPAFILILFYKRSWVWSLLILLTPIYIYQYKTPFGFDLTPFRFIFILLSISFVLALIEASFASKGLHRFVYGNRSILLLVGVIVLVYVIAYLRADPRFLHQATFAFITELAVFVTPIYFAYFITTEKKFTRAISLYISSAFIPIGVGIYVLISTLSGGRSVQLPLSNLVSNPDLLQKTAGLRYGSFLIPRFEGTFVDANFAGYYLTIVFTLLVALLLEARMESFFHKHRILSYLILSLTLLAIIFTFSRSALLMFFIVESIFLLLLEIKFRYVPLKLVLIGGSMVLGIFIVISLVFFNPFEALLARGIALGPGRVARYKAGVEVFENSPFFGGGLEAIGLKLSRPTKGINTSAHSFYLTKLAETGLIGLFFIASFFFVLLVKLLRSWYFSIIGLGLFSCGIGLLAIQVFYDNLTRPTFGVFFGIVAAFGILQSVEVRQCTEKD